MRHATGARLGPYEILSPLGAGGMGEVYKARDTRLDRIVAIKVSKERFAERFRNETLAVAALNHPHVCTLHDVGPDYLVMEYVEGKSLSGPLPLDAVLRLSGQIADALDHAHRHGIVHRDLKPANILVTKAGVKVLDFGLARRLPAVPADETETTLTQDGLVVGTPKFMAPEQIGGKPADERTDIFAFGLVLYQMLTGRHAFDGKSSVDVMEAILEREPLPISSQGRETPAALEEVVRTCLAKDPGERWQSMRELKHALAWASRSGNAPARGGRMGWLAAAASVVAFTAVGYAVMSRRAGVGRPVPARFQVGLPAGARLTWYERPAVSPDGERFAIAAVVDGTSHLFLRALNSLSVVRVPGTEGASGPFWSPDGRQIGFVAQGKLKRIDPSTGSVQVLCDVPALFGASWDRVLIMVRGFRGASWSRDGTIAFSSGGELLSVAASGGEPAPLGKPAKGETSRSWPYFLPDGRRYLYLSQTARSEDQGIYVASRDSPERKRIVDSSHDAAYSPSGHLLFVRGGALMARRFDVDRLELSGEAVPIAQSVALALPPFRGAGYSVSANGVLVWRTALSSESLQPTWFDRSGKALGKLGEPADYSNPALSPDEQRLVVSRLDPHTNTRDLWTFDIVRGNGRRLTFDPADDLGPAWSPDGAWIAFSSDRRGTREIYRKLSSGSGDDELLLESKDGPKNVEGWSPDGSFLVYNYWPGGKPADLFLLPLSSSGAAKPPIALLATPSREDQSTFALSGRWIAYRSDESGRDEVYVRSVSAQGVSGAGKWQISTEGGVEPRWRSDGREVFYVSGSNLMAVEVKGDGSSFEAGSPKALFGVSLPPTIRRNRFVVTRDGQRFLVITPTEGTSEPIDVLLNWPPPKG